MNISFNQNRYNLPLNTLLVILFIGLSPILVYSQTGPAGVGSSSSNILWLRAQDISQSNNTAISSWADQSGNSNSISQPSSAYQPLFITNQQNSFPVVRFSTNDRLRKTSFSSFPSSAITVFMVNKTSDNNDGTFSYASSTNNNSFLIFNSANYRIYRNNANLTSGQSGDDNSWHINDVSWRASDGAAALWQDGASKYTGTLSSGVNITTGGCLAIAGEQDAVDGGYESTQFHDGDFLEILVYNTSLNSAERIIVANYLAAKYSLTISNDLFTYQNTHSNELAGIGRVDASNTHTAAQSAGIIQIENPSAMTTNGEYLLFAHDEGSITSWTTTEAPNVGNIERITREWRVDETGDVGTLDFKISNINLPTLNSGFTKYALMIDADGDFSTGATIYELALSGSDYVRTGINFNDGDYISIAAIKPTIEYEDVSSSDDESSNAIITVMLNYDPASTVSVNYTTSNGTATSGSDYTAVTGGSLSITSGNTSSTFTINITDDVTQESDETFSIALSSPSTGINLGSQTTHTYTIIDNDNSRKVNFNSATANGSESTTSVNVGLTINSADPSNATTVDYSVSGGTASGGGTDYSLSSGTVTFPAGTTTTGSFNITINNDLLDEDNETIIIAMSNPINCNLGSTKTFTYTINDNDATPSIDFTSTNSSGSEAVSSKTIQLSLSAASSKNVSVSFSTSGSATNGSDYTISNSPAVITAGNTTTNITLTINNDTEVESNETVIITLSSPVNATLGTSTTSTYTIQNEDTYGYTGPGGVGKAANLKLWVKAENIPGTTDGDLVSSWPDQSGNSNNLSQTTSTFRPAYYSNIVNGLPTARFYQSNSRLIHNSYTDFPDQAITTLFVNKSTGQSNDGLLSYATTSSDNEYLIFNSSNASLFRGGNTLNSGVNISTNSWNIVQHSWQNSNDATLLYTNGTQRYSNTLVGGAITQGGNLAIGAEQDGVNSGYSSDQDYQGDFSEIIIYNFILPSAHRNIVNSYLGAKYDITVANNKYDGASAANGDYDKEVIGIGTESDGGHEEAHGSGGLWLKQVSNFGNGDYLMIGHNHVEPQIYNPTIDPKLTNASIEKRWGRDWYFDVRDAGAAYTTDLTFDFIEAGMNSASSPAGTTSDYKLLYRSLPTDNWEILFSASSINTTQVIFSGISLTRGNGYYTLGTIDSTTSPLPIELISFEATLINNVVNLHWATASETNNDFFDVERSGNGDQWQHVVTMQGQGNSNKIIHYNTYDNSPLKGISYYRLKQTDFDGTYTYSNTRVIKNESNQLSYFPNPVLQELNIETNNLLLSITAFDQLGKEHQLKSIKQGAFYKVDMSKLTNGIYYLRLVSKGSVENIKVIKQTL